MHIHACPRLDNERAEKHQGRAASLMSQPHSPEHPDDARQQRDMINDRLSYAKFYVLAQALNRPSDASFMDALLAIRRALALGLDSRRAGLDAGELADLDRIGTVSKQTFAATTDIVRYSETFKTLDPLEQARLETEVFTLPEPPSKREI